MTDWCCAGQCKGEMQRMSEKGGGGALGAELQPRLPFCGALIAQLQHQPSPAVYTSSVLERLLHRKGCCVQRDAELQPARHTKNWKRACTACAASSTVVDFNIN